MTLTSCLIDTDALGHNIRALRALVGPGALLAPTVKSNAYGHGLGLASRAFLAAGADWLCVNAVNEAQILRDEGIVAPIYILGYVGLDEIEQAMALGCDAVIYNAETLEKAVSVHALTGLVARFHVKLETGNNRQGLREEEAMALAERIQASEGAELVGVASHFANVEDTTDHRFAEGQLARFAAFCRRLEARGISAPIKHMSNSAATILWPDRCQDMARAGVAAYGMWPSSETLVAAVLAGRRRLELRPALTWRCRIAQVKDVAAGEFIGYGCSFRTTHPTRMAILPVGYYDGYDRGLSNVAHVLIEGQRAPVLGRVCMNITMVDVTDIPGARLEGEAVLLGRSGEEVITAEQMAGWANTINYEVTTRINDRIPRVAVSGQGSGG